MLSSSDIFLENYLNACFGSKALSQRHNRVQCFNAETAGKGYAA